jgi:hypothetical protein
MFEKIKNRIAHFTVRHKYLHKNKDAVAYANIIKNSFTVFIIMPEHDYDFHYSMEVLRYIVESKNKKIITLFLPEHKYNFFPEREKHKYISYHLQQINKFRLPDNKLVSRLDNQEFDVVLDLNRNEDVFFSAVANIVKSKIRVSFAKKSSESYYNLQINDKSETPEAAYKNFLNYLQMF